MNIEEQFQQVEQKYGLVRPDAYKSMYAAGWMDVKGDNYFWLHEAEWMSLEEILNHEPAEYHRPEFVPFAFTGGGDYWCWWPSVHPGTVVFCPHDCYDGQFFASSFIGFVYRSLLDFSASGFDPEDDPEEAEENREILKTSVVRLSGYFPNTWQETLEAFTTALPVQRFYNGRPNGIGLLTNEQEQAIMQRDLAFPLMDQDFQWMYPLSEEQEETAAILRKVFLETGPDVPIEEKMARVEEEKARRKNTT